MPPHIQQATARRGGGSDGCGLFVVAFLVLLIAVVTGMAAT